VAILARKEDDEPRVNEEITASEVLVIDENGVKLGVFPSGEAIEIADARMLDLVEVAPLAEPPVCRILDYGKYRYQLQKKDKDARKKQKVQALKEMKMRPKIDEHDYEFKVRAIKNFLVDGHRVKVSVFFRGREMSFLDKGEDVLNRVIADCELVGKSEGPARMEGRYMRVMLTPQSSSSAKSNKPKTEREDMESTNFKVVNTKKTVYSDLEKEEED
jgi:translation initiation factor IF-3